MGLVGHFHAMICMLCLGEWLSDREGKDRCPRCGRYAGTESFGAIRLDMGSDIAQVLRVFRPHAQPIDIGVIKGVGLTSAHGHYN